MLPMDEQEYTSIVEKLEALDTRFEVRDSLNIGGITD